MLLMLLFGMFQHKSQAPLKFAPVDQPGEGIMGGLIGHLLHEPALLGDVTKDHDRAEHPSIAVTDGGGRVVDGELLTVWANQGDRLAKTGDFAPPQTFLHW